MIRLLMVLAAILLVGGGSLTRFLDSAVTAMPSKATVASEPRLAPIMSGQTVTLASGRDHHYETSARIDGAPVDFIVDTGATLVILRESDAARAGIRPSRADYTANVSTANGVTKAARAKLDRVEIGGITVYDVPALVLPDNALWRNLLGMSFLSRLKRYEVASGRMVLEQ
ncbi:MAG: TIGR02281 family clan AA aspartic protease [Pseudolabrys sp.]|nr:TIGR02281 family clan AA aspartic protease [Pseudolabrys sp.]